MSERNLCGVLLTNKTYGRNEKGRLLYLCQPFEKSLPPCFVPFDLKSIGFSKVSLNRYILFRYLKGSGEMLQGLCVQVFGDVTSLSSYADYLLWAYRFYPHVKMVGGGVGGGAVGVGGGAVGGGGGGATLFTIDPPNAECFDDALSFSFDSSLQLWTVCIYIADVCAAFTGEMWSDEAWNGCCPTSWISNVYLHDRRLSMFPTEWVRKCCSLKAGEKRAAICLRLRFDIERALVDTTFLRGSCVVDTNDVYDCGSKRYQPFMDFTSSLMECEKGCVMDEKKLVRFWMMRFNTEVAAKLNVCGVASFARPGFAFSPFFHKYDEPSCGGVGGGGAGAGAAYQYLTGNGYLQCTSPLRRRIDFMNQYIFVRTAFGGGVEGDGGGDALLSKWISLLPSFNEKLRLTAKITSQMHLLDYVSKWEGLQQEIVVRGVAVDYDDVKRKWSVYLPSLKIFAHVRADCVALQEYSFRLFYFVRENDVRRKVRLEWVEGGGREDGR